MGIPMNSGVGIITCDDHLSCLPTLGSLSTGLIFHSHHTHRLFTLNFFLL